LSEVVDRIREAAEWRDGKAAEYPDDARNAQSAAALRGLADHVERIPDDPRVIWLAAQIQDGAFGSATARVLSRCGYDSPAERFDSFLSELCTQAARDALQLVTDGTLSPDEAVAQHRVSSRHASQALTEPLYPSELAAYGDPAFLRDCLREASTTAYYRRRPGSNLTPAEQAASIRDHAEAEGLELIDRKPPTGGQS